MGWVWQVGLGLVSQVWFGRSGWVYLLLVNIALYCSHPDIRVSGGGGGVVGGRWCKPIIVSNPTFVELRLS